MKSSNESLMNAFQKGNEFKPYISSMVFPRYKNLLPGAELTFEFPLTLLIGKNGTNKSSILHALYGSPERNSPGEYWFATHTDPIKVRPAFFYRYVIPGTNNTAEVLKTLIKKKSVARKTIVAKEAKALDPDYWEPSRPVTSYGMHAMPEFEGKLPTGRSKTRWHTIKKDVLYLDFRGEISAFDKAFYKLDKTRTRVARRRRLRAQTKALKEAIDKNLIARKTNGVERIFANYVFTQEQVATVNKILDTTYFDIRYIEHEFFLIRGFSVYLKKCDANSYSEAFAGSGETSIVRLVYALEKASKKTLVLLDEPETSLHIQAQHRLQEFLLKKIKEKHLQVVIATHSPYFAQNLPDCAIKVLWVDPDTQKVLIDNSAPADDSSFYLGQVRGATNKALVYVEDELAHAIVRHVWSVLLSPAEKDAVSIPRQSRGLY